MDTRKDIFNKEIGAFGFYDDKFTVRLKEVEHDRIFKVVDIVAINMDYHTKTNDFPKGTKFEITAVDSYSREYICRCLTIPVSLRLIKELIDKVKEISRYTDISKLQDGIFFM